MFSKIAFIGAGSIAEALISGITVNQYLHPEQISVTNKSNHERLAYLQENYRIHTSFDKSGVINNADVIILTMKPTDIVDALSEIKPYINKSQLIVTVLAGVSTDFIAKQIGLDVAVIRAMPNTSAMVGQSATSIAAGSYASKEQIQQVEELLKTIGTTTLVKEEDLHTITALAGSGPAYFYYTVESMEAAAAEAGLDKDIAKELIIQTLIGAAEMLKSTSDHPSTLRKNITSPGGTTEAGVKVLESYHYQEALVNCIKRAAERSNELGSSFESKVDR